MRKCSLIVQLQKGSQRTIFLVYVCDVEIRLFIDSMCDILKWLSVISFKLITISSSW